MNLSNFWIGCLMQKKRCSFVLNSNNLDLAVLTDVPSLVTVCSSAIQMPAEESTNHPALLPSYTRIKVRNITSLAVSFYIHMFPPVFILIRIDCVLLGVVQNFSSLRPGWESLYSECIWVFLGLTLSPCWLRFFFNISEQYAYTLHSNIHFISIKIRIKTRLVVTVFVIIMAECEPCLPNDW